MTESNEELVPLDELEILKRRADKLGITYKANIGVEALKEKIKALIDSQGVTPETVAPKKTRRKELWEDAMKLIRVRINMLNPDKQQLPGEIFTIANDIVGIVRKYVPYNNAGHSWHLPNCLYQQLKTRTYTVISFNKDKKGNLIPKVKELPEFSFEVLPPLTKEELNRLASIQRATGSFDTDEGEEIL